MQKSEQKRLCLLLFYDVLTPPSTTGSLLSFFSLHFSSVFLPGEQAAHWEQQLRPGIQQTDCDLKFTWGHRALISPKHMKQSLNALVLIYDSPDTTDRPGFSRHKHRVSAKSLPVTPTPATGVVENKTRFSNIAQGWFVLFSCTERFNSLEKIHYYNQIFNKQLMESPETNRE